MSNMPNILDKTFVVVVVAGVVFAVSLNYLRMFFRRRSLSIKAERIAGQKKAETQKPLPNSKLSPEETRVILDSSAAEIAEGIKQGRWSSYEVVLTFCRRCQLADAEFNCLTDTFFEAALKEAKVCDEQRGSALGNRPLHGVPISVKEEFEVAGGLSTWGMQANCENEMASHGLLVRQLTEQGAIVICHTNVPQLLMTFESNNRMWGRALNPWNKLRATGGSSGGEGCVIAARGSVLGIGSDIGGSIRIPSHFNGICGLKPTPGRITSVGDFEAVPTQQIIHPTAGPMARFVDDLEIALRCWFSPPPNLTDLTVPPVGFRDDLLHATTPLRIGFFNSCSVFPPAPACRRAVDMSAKILQSAGHTVVEFSPPHPERVVTFACGAFAGDGLDSARLGLGAEPLLPCYVPFDIVANLPRVVKKLVIPLLSALGLNQSARLAGDTNKLSPLEFQQLNSAVGAYRQSVLDAMAADQLDLILLPAFGLPAVFHDTAGDLTEATWYTLFANVTHLPAGIVTVTTVRDNEQRYDHPEAIEWSRRSLVERTVANSAGLPIGVQLVGKPYMDEQVLRGMKIIESGVPVRMKDPLQK